MYLNKVYGLVKFFTADTVYTICGAISHSKFIMEGILRGISLVGWKITYLDWQNVGYVFQEEEEGGQKIEDLEKRFIWMHMEQD